MVRFSQLRHDIKEHYKKQHVSIVPLVIVYCENVKDYEDQVKALLSENNISPTNYKFKGSSETFKYVNKSKLAGLLERSADALGEDVEFKILYDVLYGHHRRA